MLLFMLGTSPSIDPAAVPVRSTASPRRAGEGRGALSSMRDVATAVASSRRSFATSRRTWATWARCTRRPCPARDATSTRWPRASTRSSGSGWCARHRDARRGGRRRRRRRRPRRRRRRQAARLWPLRSLRRRHRRRRYPSGFRRGQGDARHERRVRVRLHRQQLQGAGGPARKIPPSRSSHHGVPVQPVRKPRAGHERRDQGVRGEDAFPGTALRQGEGHGPDAIAPWKFLEASDVGGGEDIRWNFAKFLVGRDGVPVKKYGAPFDAKTIERDVDALLGRPRRRPPRSSSSRATVSRGSSGGCYGGGRVEGVTEVAAGMTVDDTSDGGARKPRDESCRATSVARCDRRRLNLSADAGRDFGRRARDATRGEGRVVARCAAMCKNEPFRARFSSSRSSTRCSRAARCATRGGGAASLVRRAARGAPTRNGPIRWRWST